METKTQTAQMLDLMHRPAFSAKDGSVVHVNAAAARYLLHPGMSVTDLILTGQAEYAEFVEGGLHLTLSYNDTRFGATVVRSGEEHIFLLEDSTDDAHLQAFALAAKELRIPLSNAVAVASRLSPAASVQEQEYAAQLNRSIMQLQRIISNMSDCSNYGLANPRGLELVDFRSLLDEILSKAKDALLCGAITLEYNLPPQRIPALVYPQKVERAVYNMISNAAKFSEPGSTIHAQLICKADRLAFSVTNHNISGGVAGDWFTRYLRQPGLEDPQFGVGLGMVLIRATAAIHGGAVLLDHPEEHHTRLTITFAIKCEKMARVHSPILSIDYAGEQDHCLLELSDVLPVSLYKK